MRVFGAMLLLLSFAVVEPGAWAGLHWGPRDRVGRQHFRSSNWNSDRRLAKCLEAAKVILEDQTTTGAGGRGGG